MATKTETTERIARAVSAALRDAGISQRTASSRTGIAINTLTRRLTGYSPLNVAELAAIADLLDMTVAELINYTPSGEAA